MGKEFILSSKEQIRGRGIMSMGQNRSVMFYQIAEMLEEKLQVPCGILDQSQCDEFFVDGPTFIRFFELFMKQDWNGEGVEHLWNWAEYAAGMISNITLEPRFWKNRHRPAIYPVRNSIGPEELNEELRQKIVEFNSKCKKLPKGPHPEFTNINLEAYAEIIEQTLIATS